MKFFDGVSILFILVLILSPLGIYEMHKKKHGHPMIWILPFGDIFAASVLIHKYAVNCTNHLMFQKISNISEIIFGIIWCIVLCVTFYIADKQGYTNKSKMPKMKQTLIACGIGLVICSVFIAVVYFFF